MSSPPSETFWRMLRFDEFPVSEMSWSSFLIARSRGHAAAHAPAAAFRLTGAHSVKFTLKGVRAAQETP